MDKTTIERLAERLYASEASRTPIPPLTGEFPDMTVDDAYRVQLCNVQRVQDLGQVISGKKIGLTSPGIQKQLGVDEPDYGHLFASMDCSGGQVPADELMQPKIEAEIAFVLKADLAGGAVTVEDVRNATGYVAAAFEIVDSRVADWKIKLPDTIADNASSGRYILSELYVPVEGLDLAAITMDFYKDGKLLDSGSGAAVMGDPALAVVWLANKMWQYGVTLKKGEVILSGAFTAAPKAAKGERYEARFSILGNVSARFI